MQPGQKIEIQLVDKSGNPVRIAGVIPYIRLFHRGYGERPRYTFQGWPTNAAGRSEVTFNDLDEDRIMLSFSNLMDFNTPLAECDPTVEIWIPPESHFEEARRRILEWPSRSRPAWLTAWPTNGKLGPVAPSKVTLRGRTTLVEITVDLLTNRS